MQRRKFIKATGLTAIGMGVFGKVSWGNKKLEKYSM